MKQKAIDVQELEGAYTAIITPMKGDNPVEREIDWNKLEMLIEDQIAAGIKGIVFAGTTGQSATLSHDEQVELIEFGYRQVRGRVQVIAGSGSNCTREAIELTQAIEEKIDVVTTLHVTGYYNNPPQEGLIEHFNKIAEVARGNIILYNVPGRTSNNIDPETVIELSRNPKIIGIKEAISDMKQIEKIINNIQPNRFRVISGEDLLTVEMIDFGGKGVISATANIAPLYFIKIVKAALEGNFEEAYKLQEEAKEIIESIFKPAKNPIPLAHFFNTEVRLPLVKVERAEQAVREIMSKYSKEQLGIDLSKYRN